MAARSFLFSISGFSLGGVTLARRSLAAGIGIVRSDLLTPYVNTRSV